MDSLAIISDIHGNKEALNAVIKDIEERNIKKIICLGDIISKGTHTRECIHIVKEKCDVILKGNCEDYFASDIDIKEKSKIEAKRIAWNKSKLTDEDKEFLKSLPYSYEFYMSGRLIRLFHATPQKIDGFVGNIDSIDKLYSLFLPSSNTVTGNKADVVIYGHIHTPFIQKIYNRTVINCRISW